MTESVEARIIEIIAEVLECEASGLGPTTDLREDLGANSMGLLKVLVLAEDRLGRMVPDDRAESLRTVADITAFFAEEDS